MIGIARLRHALVGGTLLCAACATDVSQIVSVEPAPAPSAVAFALEDLSLVYGLTVMTCRGRVMWTISNERNGGTPPVIAYGVTPDGFATRVGPKPLTPGCYEVVVSGPSKTRFQIGDDGRLTAPDSGAPNVIPHRARLPFVEPDRLVPIGLVRGAGCYEMVTGKSMLRSVSNVVPVPSPLACSK